MIEYLNQNGLVKGKIPAGNACPFLNKCQATGETCPGFNGKLKPNDFSCAYARGFSALIEHEKHYLPKAE